MLLIHPPNWEYGGELWYDLHDVITQEWEASHRELVRKRFSVESWTEDFITLGFHSTVLFGVASVFRVLYEKFGVGIVDLILNYESVGDIAGLVLCDEVDYFSTQAAKKEEKQGDEGGATQPELESQIQAVPMPHLQEFLLLLPRTELEKRQTKKTKIEPRIRSLLSNHPILAQKSIFPNGFIISIIWLPKKELNSCSRIMMSWTSMHHSPRIRIVQTILQE